MRLMEGVHGSKGDTVRLMEGAWGCVRCKREVMGDGEGSRVISMAWVRGGFANGRDLPQRPLALWKLARKVANTNHGFARYCGWS